MIMEALFSGRFYPAETVTPTEPEYWEANREASRLVEELSNRLSPEDFSLVTLLRERMMDAQMLESESHFKYGFAAGLLLHEEALAQVAEEEKQGKK